MLRVAESKNPLVWNVILYSFNNKRIETFNVFNNYNFLEECIENAKKNNKNRDAFAENLKNSLMYHFWAKCEWEVIVSSWPPSKKCCDQKIDVHDQIMINWDRFVDYIWDNRHKLVSDKELK